MTETVFRHNSHIGYLRKVLQLPSEPKTGDCGRERSRSQAAVAKSLGVSVRGLGMILKGERAPGPKVTQSLATKLKWNERERAYFETLVACFKNPDDPVSQRMKADLQVASFSDVTDLSAQAPLTKFWYMIPVLVALQTESERTQDQWIQFLCHRFGNALTPQEAKFALNSLYEQGYAEKTTHTEDGRVFFRAAKKNPLHLGDGKRSDCIRHFHNQMIAKAQTALHTNPPEDREFLAATLKIRPEKFEAARRRLRDFMKSFASDFHEDEECSVFQTNIQFFSLDTPAKYEKEKS